MSHVAAIVGNGLLADFVCADLSETYEIVRFNDFREGVPESANLILVLQDHRSASFYREAEMALQSAGIPWLSGFVSFGEGVVGPLVMPGKPGCSRCAEMRRLIAGRDRREMAELQFMQLNYGKQVRDAWASRTGLLQMSRLVASESKRVLEGRPTYCGGHVYLLNLSTLESSLHFFLPDPLCPVCGRLPVDSPEAARISLQPSPKVSADSYRCRPMDELKDMLLKEYLDTCTGLMNGKVLDFVSPFANTGVNLPLFMEDEVTAGRTHSYAESELTAVLEGLERYCGTAPRGKRTVVKDSFRNLADRALNPVRMGLYSNEQYARPDFPFKPFDPEMPIDWVWGYSFLQERPILVPESLAYYSMGCGQSFVSEGSNGCALGGSLEEAVFYGILEVVERDSFLMTWYAQLPVPRIDLRSAADKELQLMVERLQAVAGFDVHLFNSTMENRIPSVWALGKNRKSTGVNLVCAAGAHPDPVRAAKGAVHELAGQMLTLDEKFEANREKCLSMFHDPFQVKRMEDHSMLYSLPQAQNRLKFLLDENRPMRTFEEEFKRKTNYADLTDELKDILLVFRRLNLEVIAVDQTTPEISRNGLHCVKVLIPGMLPMTFGYHLTRVTGLERVLRIPAELGYSKKPLTPEQLNPYPHPFP